MLTSKSYAKINLSLELLNKRDDGFHNISSIMQTISLNDIISVSLSDQMLIDSNTDSIPLETNLVYVAAQKMKEKFNINENVHIKLTKNIPMSSGLGGGSSNAATVINLLKELWDIKCSDQDLLDLASSIGSDVPFFLSGGTAFVSGRGEIINQLPDVQKFNLILITFKDLIKDKTATMYSNIQFEHFTSGAITSNLKDKIVTGKTLNNEDLFNVFDLIVPNYIPNLKNIIKILKNINFEEFHLAGSGPSLFFIIHDLKKAAYLQKELINIDYLDSFVIQSHNQSVR